MSKTHSTEQLCNSYPHEYHHASYVTRIALKLFDRTHKVLNIPPCERQLLEACCRLHDIAYAVDQDNHALISAELIIEKGLTDFSGEQQRSIAAAILMHSGDYRKAMSHTLVRFLQNRRRACSLAAFLRIADGLDHGHIQDLNITSITARKSGIVLRAESYGYARNIPWAQRKADLWNEIFPVSIQIVEEPKPANLPRFAHVISAKDTPVRAAGKIMMSLLRIMGDNHAQTVAGNDPEYLHDFRVALRRFRVALKLFQPCIRKKDFAAINNSTAEMAAILGKARDAQVMLSLLKDSAQADTLHTDPDGQKYLVEQIRMTAESHADMAAYLAGKNYQDTYKLLNLFVRVKLPCRARKSFKASLCDLTARELLSIRKDLLKSGHGIKKMKPAELHELRKKCRMARYVAEFSTPIHGKRVQQYALLLEKTADALGILHDMDMHCEHIADNKSLKLPSLNDRILTLRKEARKMSLLAWNKLCDDRTNRNMIKVLKHGA